MKIIKITANENGSRPSLQDWNGATPPNGYASIPDEFVSIFYPQDKQCGGFVTIEVNDNTVTACTWNEEAYQAYVASLPEPPDPEPTDSERLAALEEENTLLKAQVSAQSDQMDFYEDCIAEMAAVVYA